MQNDDDGCDSDDWLCYDELEIGVLINLAHGYPHNARIDNRPRLQRLRALKRSIKAGMLPALPGNLPDKPDFYSSVSLQNLWTFLTNPRRWERSVWAWAREFCERWATVCKESLHYPAVVRGSTSGAITKCKQLIIDHVAELAKQEKPKRPRKAELRETAMGKIPNLSARGFDRAWDEVAPAEWKSPGPKSSH